MQTVNERYEDKAGRAVWDDYRSRLWQFIRSRVADPHTADDILQTVFLKAHAGLGALRDGQRLAPWLYQITRNAIVDHYRARQIMDELPEDLQQPQPEQDVFHALAACVEPLVARLPEVYREAVAQSDLADVPLKVLADRAGVSLSAMKSRVQRGREQLQQALQRCCELEFSERGQLDGFKPRASSTCARSVKCSCSS